MTTGAARKPARDLGRGVIEVTAMRRPITQLIRLAAVSFVVLPGPLPLPTPTVLPIALPSISVPTVVVAPTPSLPALDTPGDPPAAVAPPSQGAQPGTSSNHAATPSGAANAPAANPPHGIVIPFTTIYVSSPLDIALIGALVTLPLLFGIWMLLFGRTFRAARRAREAQVRLMAGAAPGVGPKGPFPVNTKKPFNPREKTPLDELAGVLRPAGRGPVRLQGQPRGDRAAAAARCEAAPQATSVCLTTS